MATIEEEIEKATAMGTVTIEKLKTLTSSSALPSDGSLFKIGRPCAFDTSIDKNNRIGRYLRAKMNIVDLIPCSFSVEFSKISENVEKEGLKGLLPKLQYDQPIAEFQSTCNWYGLPSNFIGLRLFTTDDTSVADNISHNYSANAFETLLNTASEAWTNARQSLVSVGGQEVETALRGVSEVVGTKISEGITALAGALTKDTKTQDAIKSATRNITTTALASILTGSRISLPQIWSNSDYDPSLNITFKLVSPYGSPDAIKEFVIQPLMYLLLLCSPKTYDGMTYNRPPMLTVNAYGIGYSPIAAITNISLRRGGNDTSFNLYRQPLSIDVSLTISFLAKGFAAFSGDTKNSDSYEKDIYVTAGKSITSSGDLRRTSSTFTTVGRIVDSLRPMQPEDSTVLERRYEKLGSPPLSVPPLYSGATGLTASNEYTNEVMDPESLIANSTAQSASEGINGMCQNDIPESNEFNDLDNYYEDTTLASLSDDMINQILQSGIDPEYFNDYV